MTRQPIIYGGLLPSILILLFYCSNGSNNAVVPANIADSLQPVSLNKIPTTNKLSAKDSLLKDSKIDEKYYDQKTATSPIHSKKTIDSLGFKEITALGRFSNDSNYKIRIIDTLISNNRSTILVVAIETDNERWAWLLAYDDNHRINKTLLVYYQDYVEYFSSTTTTIKNNRVNITTKNDAGDDQSTVIQQYIFRNGEKLELFR